MVHRIVHRVGSREALDFWGRRLEAEGVQSDLLDGSLRFSDPERLDHELVVDSSGDAPLVATHPAIPAELAIRGFEGVRAYSSDPEGSARLLEGLMGASRNADRFVLRGDKRGGWIAFDPAPDERGRQSAGTVHHIAWGTYDADLMDWIERIDEARIPNSGYVDRHYFHSLYFREPGGVLYELATEEPGFLVDGLDVSELGTKIILPPFLEGRREQIEARLTPLPDPARSGRSADPAVGARRHTVVALERAAEVELVLEARAEGDLADAQVAEAQQTRGLEHHAIGDQLLGRAPGDVAEGA